MKRLNDFLKYVGAKMFVKNFETNPRNYDKRTPPTLLASKEYCNAVAIIESYK